MHKPFSVVQKNNRDYFPVIIRFTTFNKFKASIGIIPHLI